MREISPAQNANCEEYLALGPSNLRDAVSAIRREKLSGLRPLPSVKLLDRSTILTPENRRFLVDRVASLVDENLVGRSDMCQQYAVLMSRALAFLGVESRVVFGTAIYFQNGVEVFRWKHAWVRAGNEFIDGNVDILYENPVVPKDLSVAPFWGPLSEIPSDRRYRENRGAAGFSDNDVDSVWWPDLKAELAARK